jgi:hypothetical protein
MAWHSRSCGSQRRGAIRRKPAASSRPGRTSTRRTGFVSAQLHALAVLLLCNSHRASYFARSRMYELRATGAYARRAIDVACSWPILAMSLSPDTACVILSRSVALRAPPCDFPPPLRVSGLSWDRLIVADRGRCACCSMAGLRSCALLTTATPPRPPSSCGLARTSTRRARCVRVRGLSWGRLIVADCGAAVWRDCAHARC